MLHYENFEQAVLKEAGEEAIKWRHILPAVPLAFRNRFMNTLREGFGIPMSFDMIMLSQRLKDDAYTQFLEKAVEQRKGGSRDVDTDILKGIAL